MGKLKIESDGTKYWRKPNGDLHRLDGPAIEEPDGTKHWFINDNLHREDGPAIEHADGTKDWYQNDKLHREDGPAIEYADGTKVWLQNDKHHRLDGPAFEDTVNGREGWWIDGKALNTIDVKNWINDNNADLSTEEDQVAFKLTFG